ncbi:MAG: hypothetical protein RBT15_01745 [Gudongella sp.]|jgi:V/A-type H+-transporting ATPase subunit G/H|nr:hypothetical protein [Gudongella sp.]
MAMDAIQIVRDAEDKSREILESANSAAKKSVEEAEVKSMEEFNRISLEAQKQAEEIKKKAAEDGESTAKPILEQGIREAEALRQVDSGKLDPVIDIIIERIVKTDGNS